MGLYRFGRSTFDATTRVLECDGVEVGLRGKVAELLALLLERPNEVIASDDLRGRLWPDGFVETGNLAQQVYLLRRALAVDPSVAVENIARIGYRLRARVAPSRHRAEPGAPVLRFGMAVVAAAALLVLPGAASLVGSGVENVDAPGAQAYALGRYFLERRGTDNLQRAKVFFDQAIAAAPASALGYAGRADVWGLRADGIPMRTRTHKLLAQRALADANTAVARNPNSTAAHAALGLALLESRAPTALAMAELRRAMDLDPRNADAQEWYAIQLLFARDLRNALRHAEAAAEVQPQNVAVTSWQALIRYYLRDTPGAVAGFRTALEINPSFDFAQLGLVAALVDRGRYRDAQQALREVHPTSWSSARALRALAVIVDLRLGLRRAADNESRRFAAEDLVRKPGDDDEFVIAALALDGRRSEARRLRARMHLDADPYLRLMTDLDPIIGPVVRGLGGDV